MSTYTQILYHIVFSTKKRKKSLFQEKDDLLYRYIWGIVKNKKCHLYRINGIADHIHIVTHLHPSIALADFVKDINVASSVWIKKENIFPEFDRWQSGYGAFTYSIDSKNDLIEYVKNQKEHHRKLSFEEEFRSLLIEHGIDFDKKYLY
ncbi:MAG: IS200/IS605 family transposase [Candidatus Marinimicrobia bacterium]|nr:IS200/IS605 family transposase [bacterium]MCG2716281.1 IS200/IS605 family transposase [Candidatus Neomarinimicrobiota bacterium]